MREQDIRATNLSNYPDILEDIDDDTLTLVLQDVEIVHNSK